jgi:hypothetical protein
MPRRGSSLHVVQCNHFGQREFRMKLGVEVRMDGLQISQGQFFKSAPAILG